MNAGEAFQSCPTCGLGLDPTVSGNMGQILGWSDRWPCPDCDVGSPAAIVASEGGIAVEQPPVLLTIRPQGGEECEVMVGLGSIANPDPNPLVLSLPGTEALEACKTFVKGARDSEVAARTYIEREKAKLGITPPGPA